MSAFLDAVSSVTRVLSSQWQFIGRLYALLLSILLIITCCILTGDEADTPAEIEPEIVPASTPVGTDSEEG